MTEEATQDFVRRLETQVASSPETYRQVVARRRMREMGALLIEQ